MSRTNLSEKILDAAEDLVIEIGANHLTLDAVAKRTGLSKGGLIYHFRSKELLLQAMLKRLITRFDQSRAASDLNDRPGHELQAYIRSYAKTPPRDERLMGTFLAVAGHNPKLLEPANEAYCRLFRELKSTALTTTAQTAIIMAALSTLR